MAGKKGRSGPKKGNINSVRNGVSLVKNRPRLTVGELPLPMISVKREARKYRRELEAEVLRVKGVIGLTDAHHIDTAAAATTTAGICRWVLRNRFDSMKTADIMSCTQAMTKAKRDRDTAVRMIGLDAKALPAWVIEANVPLALEDAK